METVRTEVLRILIRATDEASAKLRAVGAEANAVGGHVSNMSKGLRTLGVGLIGAGTVAAGVIADSVRAAADFQQTTQTLANNTNMTAAQLDGMRKVSMQLAAQTGQDSADIAKGYMYVANHAYEGAAAANILAVATKNAAATNGVASDDANILAGVLREYNVSAKDAAKNTDMVTRYMDVLHNAVANSNFTMKDFAEGSKRALAQAALYGVPLSQVTAQLALMSEHGFPSVHIAALNWAGMLRSLEFPTNKALAGMQSLSKATGVDLVGDIQKLRQNGAFLPQFLADIQKATGGDPTKLHSIMTQSSYRQALEALIRNKDELDRIQRLTGAAQAGIQLPGMTGTNEAFAKEQTTLVGKLKDLQQAFNNIKIAIGTAFLPVLTQAAQVIAPLVQQFGDWINAHQTLTRNILLGTVALGALAGAFMAVGFVVEPLVAILGLLASPIGLLLVAGAGLYEAWTHDWGGIRESTQQAWQAIQPAIQAVTASVQDVIAAYRSGGLGAAAREAWAQVQALTGQAVAWLQGQAPKIRAQLLTWGAEFAAWVGPAALRLLAEAGALGVRFLAWIGQQTAPLRARLLTWATEFVAWVPGAGERFLKAWPSILSRFLDWIGGAVGQIAKALGPWALKFIEWVGPMIPGFLKALALIYVALTAFIAETALTTARKLVDWGLKFVEWVAPQVKPMLGELGKLAQQLGTWIVNDAAPAIGTQLLHWAQKFAAWVLKDAWPQLQPALGTLKDNVVAWITGDAWNAITTAIKDWTAALSSWVLKDAWPALHTDLGTLRDDLLKWLGGLGGDLAKEGENLAGKLITSFLNKVKSAPGLGGAFGIAQSAASTAANAASGAAHAVTSHVPKISLPNPFGGGDHKAQARQTGQDITNGVAEGIRVRNGGVTAAINQVAESAHTAFKNHPKVQVQSPSKAYYAIGLDMMRGLAQGVGDGVATVGSAIAAMAQQAGTAFQQAHEHYVKPHLVKAYTDINGHFHKAHEVAGHWAHNRGYGTASAGSTARTTVFGIPVPQGGTQAALPEAVAKTLAGVYSQAVLKAIANTVAGVATTGNANTLTRGALSAERKATKDEDLAKHYEQLAGIYGGSRGRTDYKRMQRYMAEAAQAVKEAGQLAGFALSADQQNGLDTSIAASVAAWAKKAGSGISAADAKRLAMNIADKASGMPVSAALSLGPSALPGYSGPTSVDTTGLGLSGASGGSYGGGNTFNISITVDRGAITVEHGGNVSAAELAKAAAEGAKQAIQKLYSSQARTSAPPRSTAPGALLGAGGHP